MDKFAGFMAWLILVIGWAFAVAVLTGGGKND